MAPVPLIIDTDPGIDDILAIFLALARPDRAKVEAITLNFGNTTLDHQRNNILRTFNVLHQHVAEDPEEPSRKQLAALLSKDASPIILSHGAEGPLGGKRFTASYFHGRDGISGVSQLPGDPFPVPSSVPSPLQESDQPAHEVMLDILRKHPPKTVRIAAIGPLTNIALAWQKDPETFVRVAGISVMGGALDVPGNTTPCAEFNTFADPFAVRSLLHDAQTSPVLSQNHMSRLPIDLLPLDITSQHVIPFARLCDKVKESSGILQRYTAAILASPRRATNSYAPTDKPFDPAVHDQFTAHDPLAVAHAMFCSGTDQNDRWSEVDELRDGWHIRTRRFGVEAEGVLTRGLYVVDRRAHGKAKPGESRVEKGGQGTQAAQDVPPASNGADQSSASRQNGTEAPAAGAWDVVTASPGITWFANTFCDALGV